jgi:hypothetical protein
VLESRRKETTRAKGKIKLPEHSSAERKRWPDELMARSDINERLESLIEEMYDFAQEYGMNTVEFLCALRRWQAGQ